MKLYTAHKILMGSAAAGCLAYVAWATVQFLNNPVAINGAMLGASLVVTGGVGVYLRAFIRRVRSMAAPREPQQS